jgi:hypothetical protein
MSGVSSAFHEKQRLAAIGTHDPFRCGPLALKMRHVTIDNKNGRSETGQTFLRYRLS